MKITNKTRINTKQLGALIRAVAVKECFNQDEIDSLNVRVRYRRRTHARPHNHPGGYAYYKSSIFCLSFVKDVQPDPVGTAKVIAHELAHCQGVHHGKAMSNPHYGWKPGWQEYWSWASDYPLELRVEAVKPTGEAKVEKEITRCQKALEVWRRKQKLANTKLRKWKTRLGYYEKRKAAMTTSHEAAVQQVEAATGDHNGDGA